MDLGCVIITTSLYYICLDHAHDLANDCGALVKMPMWCALAFWAVLAISAATVALGFIGPAWRKKRGETETIDAVGSALIRVFVALGATIYAYLMYHASAPYHVPCF